jgi:hypothetical protein
VRVGATVEIPLLPDGPTGTAALTGLAEALGDVR